MSAPVWLTRLWLRLRATISGARARDVRDELALHLQLLEEEYTSRGLPAEKARALARREFGNASRFQETSHDLFAFRAVEDVAHDLRYAVREMRRRPAFTAAVVASLAVGIGAATAAFAIVDALMLRGLSVREPDRLVAFASADGRWSYWPHLALRRWQEAPGSPLDVAGASDVITHRPSLASAGSWGDVRITLVSTNYFQVMGAALERGRAFAPDDVRAPVAIVNGEYWRRSLAARNDISGMSVEIDGVRYPIVGVARRGFGGHAIAQPTDVWLPIAAETVALRGPSTLLATRWANAAPWLHVLGRLRAGATIEQATAFAELTRQRVAAEKVAELGGDSPEVARDRRQTFALSPAATGHAPERSRYARPLSILSTITLLVLLVACANFTNLMLARAESRRRELAIRMAIGGGRWRLIRQATTECLMLAVTAGALGLLLASWATSVTLDALGRLPAPVTLSVAFDGRILGVATACVLLSVIFGSWPGTRPPRSAAELSMHRPAATGYVRPRMLTGRLLLVAQLAMCTVLLIAAGLLLRTVANLRFQDIGFERDALLVSVSPGRAGYSGDGAQMLIDRIRERLLAVPGIHAVGVSGPPVLDPNTYWIDSSERLRTDRGIAVPGRRWTFAPVGPGFFDAVGMSLVGGRAFDRWDRDDDALVINQSMAALLFGGENPVGRQVQMHPRARMQRVIGVVNDVRQTSPRDRGTGVVYQPLRDFGSAVLAVRSAVEPSEAASVVLHQLSAIAPDLPVEKVSTIGQLLDEAIAQERLMSAISLVLAALAIVIGCIGLYALMAYHVAQRTHELGVRLALGATAREVAALVVRASAGLVLPALAVGIPLGVWASHPLASQLYDVTPTDHWTIVGAALLITAVALVATLRPARTASRIDPIALLHSD